MENRKKQNKNMAFAFLGVIAASVISNIYALHIGYSEHFASGNGWNIVSALFEILIFGGILPAVLTYVVALVLYSIAVRYSRAQFLDRNDFVLYIMAYSAGAKLLMGIVNAFCFLNPGVLTFTHYINGLGILSAFMIAMFNISLEKRIMSKVKSKVFLALGLPYILYHIVVYFSNVLMYLRPDIFEEGLKMLGYSIIKDPNEIYAIICGAILLAGLLIYYFLMYNNLVKKDKSDDGFFVDYSGEEDVKVFDEFDI